MSKNMLETARRISLEDPSIITPRELRILELYSSMEVKKICNTLSVSSDQVYGIFRRIRERRRKVQRAVNFWNSMARDKRFYHVLTPKPQFEEEGEDLDARKD